MTVDEFRKIIYDLHKENREDIRDLRNSVTELRLVVKGLKTTQKIVTTVFGMVGGGIVAGALKFFF